MGAPFGKATAVIGGRRYELVFNFTAMAAIERHPLGCPFQELAAELSPNPDGSAKTDVRASTIALLLWGCLRAKHPGVSFDDVGGWLLGNEETLAEATDALLNCLSDAFPEAEANDRPRKRAKAGTGTRS